MVRLAVLGHLDAATILAFLQCHDFVPADAELVPDRVFPRTAAFPQHNDYLQYVARHRLQEELLMINGNGIDDVPELDTALMIIESTEFDTEWWTVGADELYTRYTSILESTRTSEQQESGRPNAQRQQEDETRRDPQRPATSPPARQPNANGHASQNAEPERPNGAEDASARPRTEGATQPNIARLLQEADDNVEDDDFGALNFAIQNAQAQLHRRIQAQSAAAAPAAGTSTAPIDRQQESGSPDAVSDFHATITSAFRDFRVYPTTLEQATELIPLLMLVSRHDIAMHAFAMIRGRPQVNQEELLAIPSPETWHLTIDRRLAAVRGALSWYDPVRLQEELNSLERGTTQGDRSRARRLREAIDSRVQVPDDSPADENDQDVEDVDLDELLHNIDSLYRDRQRLLDLLPRLRADAEDRATAARQDQEALERQREGHRIEMARLAAQNERRSEERRLEIARLVAESERILGSHRASAENGQPNDELPQAIARRQELLEAARQAVPLSSIRNRQRSTSDAPDRPTWVPEGGDQAVLNQLWHGRLRAEQG